MSERPEKKSERFEVRLPYSKKQDFVQACEDQGDTPSSAVRRFIDSYVRRADADIFKSFIKAMPGMLLRNWLQVIAWVIGLVLISLFVYALLSILWTGRTMSKVEYMFSAYDKDKSGIIELGEISEFDEPLHRILNVDGIAGISKEEFWHKGKITWAFVNPETFEIVEQSDGIFKHTSKTSQVKMNEGDTDYTTHIVEFDLTDVKAPKVATWQRGAGTSISPKTKNNGSVHWIEGQNKPAHVMGTNRDVFLRSQ